MKLPTQCTAWLTAAAALLAMAATAPAGADDAWLKVGTDAHGGVSGAAYEGRTDAGTDVLVVHDNKRSGQPRLSRITHGEGSAAVTPLVWDGAEPSDLEAIEAVPGAPGEFLALAGRGIVYRLKVTGAMATVVDYAPLPAIGEGDDFESFALVAQNGNLAALWADRGAGAGRPATVYAAPLTFASWGQPLFGTVTRRDYRATYPTGDGTRYISDISVTDSGRILASSAADAGDDGPFDSAVSNAGSVTVTPAGRVRLMMAASPAVLETHPGYKIEAVECLPGTTDAFLGTDDENHGGYVRTTPLCAA
ncbi:hypothetical protein DMB38_18320 [Streptomyces sp. WAC 06738]|uniref:hypothetical protein n=1 Tax=Streptomyces sp. WAC 06738 TaxID=2203210 RepID=UPI000F707709|nr:hypothetical protein [Streptomyces sp. WAC 06738]AZM47487.1 hypothetical protein DMB38_18320 [Streptomyces sp. WAC 06738]